MRENIGDWGQIEKMLLSCPPGVESQATPLPKSLPYIALFNTFATTLPFLSYSFARLTSQLTGCLELASKQPLLKFLISYNSKPVLKCICFDKLFPVYRFFVFVYIFSFFFLIVCVCVLWVPQKIFYLWSTLLLLLLLSSWSTYLRVWGTSPVVMVVLYGW